MSISIFSPTFSNHFSASKVTEFSNQQKYLSLDSLLYKFTVYFDKSKKFINHEFYFQL